MLFAAFLIRTMFGPKLPDLVSSSYNNWLPLQRIVVVDKQIRFFVSHPQDRCCFGPTKKLIKRPNVIKLSGPEHARAKIAHVYARERMIIGSLHWPLLFAMHGVINFLVFLFWSRVFRVSREKGRFVRSVPK